jgi:hypothetical protein
MDMMRQRTSYTYRVQVEMTIGQFAPHFNQVPLPYNNVQRQYNVAQRQYINAQT